MPVLGSLLTVTCGAILTSFGLQGIGHGGEPVNSAELRIYSFTTQPLAPMTALRQPETRQQRSILGQVSMARCVSPRGARRKVQYNELGGGFSAHPIQNAAHDPC